MCQRPHKSKKKAARPPLPQKQPTITTESAAPKSSRQKGIRLTHINKSTFKSSKTSGLSDEIPDRPSSSTKSSFDLKMLRQKEGGFCVQTLTKFLFHKLGGRMSSSSLLGGLRTQESLEKATEQSATHFFVSTSCHIALHTPVIYLISCSLTILVNKTCNGAEIFREAVWKKQRGKKRKIQGEANPTGHIRNNQYLSDIASLNERLLTLSVVSPKHAPQRGSSDHTNAARCPPSENYIILINKKITRIDPAIPRLLNRTQ